MSKKIEKMRKALRRSNTRLLLSAVMVFQASCMLLLAFRPETFSLQALALAVLLPLGTMLFTTLCGKLWPIDRAIMILVMLLVTLGIIILQAIAKSESTPRTHAVYACLGIFAMGVGILFIRRWNSWKKYARPLAVLCVLALLSPWVLGRWHYGARNWIEFGSFSLQPSEFMKPVMVVILASGFSNRPRFVKCLPPIGFAAVCCAILLSERDMGAVLLYFLTTVFMYYAATSNALLSVAGLGMGCVAAVAAYHAMPHVQDRIAIWINPWQTPQDEGYQLVQALIAIGSGGMFGMGLGLGSPRIIPLYHSDFIFASMAEEFGLLFSICLLAVYVIIILRGLIVAMNARTSFHSLTAFGLVVLLGLQTMLIVGGNTKLLPLTGVTLPLISYGGSSLVSTMFSMGLLLGISSMNAEDEAHDIALVSLREEVRP
ncbi:MAG: FtsW/RodA/SpoVE family cell cycle protein [Christensenellales bacterium]|nr:FtsW/RodA/SpoVE family cell cycle protein [Christensenellales bacterium]